MKPVLRAVAISFAYRDRPVLTSVHLELHPGQVVALLGPNGSGKSTLIRVLTGSLHAQGSIEWDSRDIRRWKPRELARRVAYLPQNPAWDATQSVAEALNLGRAPYWRAFGVESSSDHQVVGEVAEMLGLTDLLPRRLDQISGGQRQRVFLGRCLVQQPAALLLDEPNTFLDLHHQVELGRLLRRLATERNIAILMASHDLNLAGAFADQMLLLNEGQVVKAGSVTEVMDPDVLSAVYGVPIERVDARGTPVVVPVL